MKRQTQYEEQSGLFMLNVRWHMFNLLSPECYAKLHLFKMP